MVFNSPTRAMKIRNLAERIRSSKVLVYRRFPKCSTHSLTRSYLQSTHDHETSLSQLRQWSIRTILKTTIKTTSMARIHLPYQSAKTKMEEKSIIQESTKLYTNTHSRRLLLMDNWHQCHAPSPKTNKHSTTTALQTPANENLRTESKPEPTKQEAPTE